jgi:hypothetical protein
MSCSPAGIPPEGEYSWQIRMRAKAVSNKAAKAASNKAAGSKSLASSKVVAASRSPVSSSNNPDARVDSRAADSRAAVKVVSRIAER